MARVEIDETVLRQVGTYLQAVTGAQVQVSFRGGAAATVYAAETGGTTLPQPLVTVSGRIFGWLEQGSYDFAVSDPAGRFSAYTEPVEISSAGSGLPLTDPASAGSVSGAAVFKNATREWYGESFNVGDVPSSFGFSGSPLVTPATTITANVSFPLTNGTVPVADCAQLDAAGGSFTLGGTRVAYLGRSAASGAGNATGCFTIATASGSALSGTALGNTPTGYFAQTIYKRFGYDGRPSIGSAQAFGVVASARSPMVDDSAEAGSFVMVMADSGQPQYQRKTVTGGEMTAQLGGNWNLLDGYTAALTGGGSRTAMTATDHAKNVIGHKLSHIAGGFMQQYDGLYQTSSAVQTFGTLNGAATLPQASIPVTGTFPPATVANPVTVLVGPNAAGAGGQLVTYTGQGGGSLTGCTGGSGTVASGSSVTNNVRAINVRDRVESGAGFLAGTSGWSGTVSAVTKGGTDALLTMVNVQGPTNAEVTGGLTQLVLRAGAGQTRSIAQFFDQAGTSRLAISKDGTLITTGQQIIANTSGGTATTKIDGTKGLQVGNLSQGVTNTPFILGCTGVPTLAGALGDIALRGDGGVGSTIYRCTTAGAAGVAVWTAIL